MDPIDPKTFGESHNEQVPIASPHPKKRGPLVTSMLINLGKQFYFWLATIVTGKRPKKIGPLAITMMITLGTQFFFWLMNLVTGGVAMIGYAMDSVPLLFVVFFINGIRTWKQKDIGSMWIIGTFLSLIVGFGTCTLGYLAVHQL